MNNIVLVGGSTKLRNFKSRFLNEFSKVYNYFENINDDEGNRNMNFNFVDLECPPEETVFYGLNKLSKLL